MNDEGTLGILISSPELGPVTTAVDLMRPAVSVRAEDDLATAIEKMLENGVRELAVTDADGRFLGVVDDKGVSRAYKDNGTTRI